MTSTNLTIDFKEIAAKLAHMPSDEQGLFLTTFLKELCVVCETPYRTENQLSWIAKDLSAADRELLSMLSMEGE